jgi:ATP-dependent DNA ligase
MRPAMRLLRIPEPFDHPHCVFEPKMDGFRTLAQVTEHVSRNGNTFKSWLQLQEEIAHSVRAYDAILDGEIACLGPRWREQLQELLCRREWPFVLVFALLMLGEGCATAAAG